MGLPDAYDLTARAAYGLEIPDTEHEAFCIALDLSRMGYADLAAEQWSIIDAAGERGNADEALKYLDAMFTMSRMFKKLNGAQKH